MHPRKSFKIWVSETPFLAFWGNFWAKYNGLKSHFIIFMKYFSSNDNWLFSLLHLSFWPTKQRRARGPPRRGARALLAIGLTGPWTWWFYQYKFPLFSAAMNNLVASSLFNIIVETMLNNIVEPTMLLMLHVLQCRSGNIRVLNNLWDWMSADCKGAYNSVSFSCSHFRAMSVFHMQSIKTL